MLPLQAFSDKLKICGVLGADAPLVHCRHRFRGGVASSAVSAYTIRLAARVMREMATFDSAGISGRG